MNSAYLSAATAPERDILGRPIVKPQQPKAPTVLGYIAERETAANEFKAGVAKKQARNKRLGPKGVEAERQNAIQTDKAGFGLERAMDLLDQDDLYGDLPVKSKARNIAKFTIQRLMKEGMDPETAVSEFLRTGGVKITSPMEEGRKMVVDPLASGISGTMQAAGAQEMGGDIEDILAAHERGIKNPDEASKFLASIAAAPVTGTLAGMAAVDPTIDNPNRAGDLTEWFLSVPLATVAGPIGKAAKGFAQAQKMAKAGVPLEQALAKVGLSADDVSRLRETASANREFRPELPGVEFRPNTGKNRRIAETERVTGRPVTTADTLEADLQASLDQTRRAPVSAVPNDANPPATVLETPAGATRAEAESRMQRYKPASAEVAPTPAKAKTPKPKPDPTLNTPERPALRPVETPAAVQVAGKKEPWETAQTAKYEKWRKESDEAYKKSRPDQAGIYGPDRANPHAWDSNDPWEITLREFKNIKANYGAESLAPKIHAESVKDALEKGYPVPPEVLRDYPQLAKVASARNAVEAKGVASNGDLWKVGLQEAKDAFPKSKAKIVASNHRAAVQQAIRDGKISSHPDYPELDLKGMGKKAPAKVKGQRQSPDEIMAELRNRPTGQTPAPTAGTKPTTIKLDPIDEARSVRRGYEPDFASEQRSFPKTGKPNGVEVNGNKVSAYDANGNLVGTFQHDGKAFKVSVRPDAERQGIGTRLLDAAQKSGYDIEANILNNSFTPEGRNLTRKWLQSKKLETPAPVAPTPVKTPAKPAPNPQASPPASKGAPTEFAAENPKTPGTVSPEIDPKTIGFGNGQRRPVSYQEMYVHARNLRERADRVESAAWNRMTSVPSVKETGGARYQKLFGKKNDRNIAGMENAYAKAKELREAAAKWYGRAQRDDPEEIAKRMAASEKKAATREKLKVAEQTERKTAPIANDPDGTPMTSAEWAKIGKDYKDIPVRDGVRVRTAILNDGKLHNVYLTDKPSLVEKTLRESLASKADAARARIYDAAEGGPNRAAAVFDQQGLEDAAYILADDIAQGAAKSLKTVKDFVSKYGGDDDDVREIVARLAKTYPEFAPKVAVAAARAATQEPTTIPVKKREPTPTTIRNADTDAVAAKEGMRPRAQVEPKSAKETQARGVEGYDPDKSHEVVLKVESGQALNDDEMAALKPHFDAVIIARRKARTALEADPDNPALKAKFDEAAMAADRVRDAGNASGVTWSRAGSARKNFDVVDYSDVDEVLSEARTATGGKLNPKQQSEFEKLTKEYNAALTRADEMTAKVAKLEADAVMRGVAQSSRRVRTTNVAARRAEAKKRMLFSGKAQAFADPEQAKAFYDYFKTYVSEGAKLDDVLAKIKAETPELSKLGITDADMLDAIALGGSPNAAKRANTVLMREIKRLKAEARALTGREAPKATRTPRDPAESLRKQIADVEARIKSGEVKAPGSPSDPALKNLRSTLAKLRAQEKMLATGASRPTKDAARLSNLNTTIADLEDQLKTGNYRLPEAREAIYSPAVMDAKLKADVLRTRIKDSLAQAKANKEYDDAAPFVKFAQQAWNLAGVPRNLLASGDNSAPFRQGIYLLGRNPKQFVRSFGQMLKNYKPGNFEQQTERLLSRPLGNLGERAGLAIDKAMTQTEGMVGVNSRLIGDKLLAKTPGVAQVQRFSGDTFSGFLNEARAGMFDDLVGRLEKTQGRKITLDEAKELARFTNIALGKGDLGKFKNAADTLSKVFFAPGYTVSRYQLLGAPLRAATKGGAASREIANDWVKSAVGLMGTFGTIAYLKGGTVEMDPHSSDFGKASFKTDKGIMVWDMFAGIPQPIKTAVQIATGKKKSGFDPNAKPYAPHGGTIKENLKSKASPLVSEAWSALDNSSFDYDEKGGKNGTGAYEKYDPKDLPRRLLPINVDQLIQGSMKGADADKLAAAFFAQFWGANISPRNKR